MMLFLQSIINTNVKPKAIILLNSAVQMAFGKNETIGKLTVLEEQGSKIMVCVSSLQEYEYTDRLSVGFEASMDEICETMMTSLKVITL
jgi:intracellular sulfur oxidation DsrE/DsrF family protein